MLTKEEEIKYNYEKIKYIEVLDFLVNMPSALIINTIYCLKFFNGWPFNFSEERNHVWLVFLALESILKKDSNLFPKNKEGKMLGDNIIDKYFGLSDYLVENKLLSQMWIATFFHDIAKYAVRNPDHAQPSADLVRDFFNKGDLFTDLSENAKKRIEFIIRNHDAVGNIVSSAERAPRYLTEQLNSLYPNDLKEREKILKMLILISFCDLCGTRNGEFVNDDQAQSRLNADEKWLEEKEVDLFNWRQQRLVRASEPEKTKKKIDDWSAALGKLPGKTRNILEKQFGKNIKVFTNLLYLALVLTGEELVKLFAIISSIVESNADNANDMNSQVDFTNGVKGDNKDPVVIGFREILNNVKLESLEISNEFKITASPFIKGIRVSIKSRKPFHLEIDSKFPYGKK